MSDRILHDSTQGRYRSPFGAVPAGRTVTLRVRVPLSCPATGAEAVLRRDGGVPLHLPLGREADDDGYASFAGSFTPSLPGLCFYYFVIKKAGGDFRLFRYGLRDTNMEAGDEWQITVYDRDFRVPENFRGGIMYQIFPDRFAIGGEILTEGKMQPFRVHKSTSEQPDPQPDPDGTWNADFFGGNFRGIEEKLDYLKGLGVGIIYLNPIFKARSNHRYDTCDYLSPDPMLGTEEDFARLCRAAKERGTAVILDGAFSHTGSDSIYFKDAIRNPDSKYRAWYKFKKYPDDYECWWDVKSLPCVEETEPSYAGFIMNGEDSVLAKWLSLGASGFRLDVADELPDSFISSFRAALRERNPDALLIGEVWEDASNKISYGERRRYFTQGELDGVMNYPFRNAVVGFASGRVDGQEFEETVMKIVENYPRDALLCSTVFLSSHDTARLRTVLEGDIAAIEKAVALACFLPGIFCVYYGDETGMAGGPDPYNRAFFSEPADGEEIRRIFRKYLSLRAGRDELKTGDVTVRFEDGKLTVERTLGDKSIRLTVDCDAGVKIEE